MYKSGYKMENRKQKKKVVKPKNRFTICCFCINSASSEIDIRNPLGGNEAYDYVVEKLAIKKVPISLFATDEDLEEMQNVNSSISMGDCRYTMKDKRSAVIFSSCYTKIPKNVKTAENESDKLITRNKDLSAHKSQENETITEVNTTESYKDLYTPVSSSEKETVTAEVYSEPSITKKFLQITPQLQETINELGSKQRPTGSPSIKQRIVSRPNTGTTNIVSPVSIDRRPLAKTKPNLQISANESQELSRSESSHQKTLKQMFTPSHKDEEIRVISEGFTCEQRQANEINALLSNLANKAAASQKWKIIIKEHEDEEGGDDVDVTTHKSTDSGSEYISESDTVFETE